MITYRAALCGQIIHPQMTRMTQILYFFSAYDKDLGEAPLKNPCYLRHLRMKNEHTVKFPFTPFIF